MEREETKIVTDRSGQSYRLESDSMGSVRVPVEALWGAQTQRAVENFPISGYRFTRPFIRALGMVKYAAVDTNMFLGLLDEKIGGAISEASREVMGGKWDDQFVVDVFQTGSGTSTNMNANEVIANRANLILGGELGKKSPVHPNDHVNMCQSSNDVIPTCLHIAAVEGITRDLLPALSRLLQRIDRKVEDFDRIVKIGRTHLQDAVPVRLGQEFSGYAGMVMRGMERIHKNLEHLWELALGGTAVGTGLNAHPKFASMTIDTLNRLTNQGYSKGFSQGFKEAPNHFEAQGSRDAVVELSGSLRTLAVSLTKIANDIRWMGSGPYGGIGEINLPEVQPGSSIMPGKVNPVVPEALLQVAAQVIGNDSVMTLSGLSGNFELNVMMPVMAHNLLSSIHLLTNGVIVFAENCLYGITPNLERCNEGVEKSLAMVTALNPHIGYDAAAEVAREAYRSGKSLRRVVLDKKLMTESELDKVLDPYLLTGKK